MNNNVNQNLPKLVITDIDGVWTDAGMYYDCFDNELKKFNTKDSTGVFYLKSLNIPIAIITGENTTIVQRRAEKLNIDYLFMGIKNKIDIVYKLSLDLNITLDEMAFIGDEINDYQLFKSIGITACPLDANKIIKSLATYNLEKKGGEGVFLEFVENLLGLDLCLKLVKKRF